MAAFARANAPFYREHYRGLPESVADPTLLPVTSKPQLMARFDDWVTDRAVALDAVRVFVADLQLIGEPILGKYLVATTSGTTGASGIFVLDERYLAVNAALQFRIFSSWLTPSEVVRLLGHGMRTALLFAPNGGFVGVAASIRYRRDNRWLAARYRVLSVHTPIAELVATLNQFRPVVLIGYASIVVLLASEQDDGRLRLDPVLVVPTAEGLPEGEYERIARTFGAKVRNLYGATESGYVAYGCEHGWLHVNGDWVVLEPVDADFQPVPPGTPSHTVLLSNLANRVQPILRYDLGDRIIQRPDPCPCGDPLPAIRVRGRTADVLTFPAGSGGSVAIPALALELDQIPGIERAQIVQRRRRRCACGFVSPLAPIRISSGRRRWVNCGDSWTLTGSATSRSNAAKSRRRCRPAASTARSSRWRRPKKTSAWPNQENRDQVCADELHSNAAQLQPRYARLKHDTAATSSAVTSRGSRRSASPPGWSGARN